MARGRLVVFGVVIALVSIALTALAFLLVLPRVLPNMASWSPEPEEDRSGGEARDVTFNADERTQILVALQDMDRGFRIPSDGFDNAVGVREWPSASVPRGAVIIEGNQDPEEFVQEQIEGRLLRTDYVREQPLLWADVVEDVAELAQTGSVTGAQLPAGMHELAIPIDKISGLGYNLVAGDRVDLIASIWVLDYDADFQSPMPNSIYGVVLGTQTEEGRTTAQVMPEGGAVYGRIEEIPPGELANIVPSGPQRARLVTHQAVPCALVMQVGVGQPARVSGDPSERPADSTAPQTVPELVTLALTPQQVNDVVWAMDQGIQLTLAKCSTQEAAAETSNVTLQYWFETHGIQVPPRLPYGVEPAQIPTPVGAGQGSNTP